MNRRTILFICIVLSGCTTTDTDRPNFLFYIADDMSPFTDIQDIPAFRGVEDRGVSFTNAFTNAPSCTPARGVILTGQHLWDLKEGGTLFGALPAELPVFPLLLEEAGYTVGHTGKAWGPGSLKAGGYEEGENPVGTPYQSIKLDPAPDGMSATDYAANFEAFMAERDEAKPFFFWYGSFEPHRRFRWEQGAEAGKDPSEVDVPPSMLDNDVMRNDILDYDIEVEHADQHLGRMIAHLEELGELDNTIIVITSDHGMAFPRAKATGLYDDATLIPLMIAGPGVVGSGREVTDFATLMDLPATILDLAGLPFPDAMVGQSLKPQLHASEAGRIDAARNFMVSALERHTLARPDDLGYPMRAIRTDDFLLVHNYEPDRWPAGDPDFESVHQGIFGDIDTSPAKAYLIEHQVDPAVAPYFEWAMGQRPEFELFDLAEDPHQLNNLADDPGYSTVKDSLNARLNAYLEEYRDPRFFGKSPWDQNPYYFETYHLRAADADPDRWVLN